MFAPIPHTKFDKKSLGTSEVVLPTISSIKGFQEVFSENIPAEAAQEMGQSKLNNMAESLWQLLPENGKKPLEEAIIRLRESTDQVVKGIPTRTVIEIVQPDMPFLVDSVTAEINRHGYTVLLVIHPVIEIKAKQAVSLMHVRIPAVIGKEAISSLQQDLKMVLKDVHAAYRAWPLLSRATGEIANNLEKLGNIPEPQQQEVVAFLRWLQEDNFTFLGYRKVGFNEQGETTVGGGLGILEDDTRRIFSGARDIVTLPDDIKEFLRGPDILHLRKANETSKVHRPVPMDVISVKAFDEEGNLEGEHRLVGLFTSAAYHTRATNLPVIRSKIQQLFSLSGIDPNSHDGKALEHIIETYPRDELFQASTTELLETCTGILQLQDQQRLALFMRKDPYERFVACLLYVPREQYSLNIRRRLQQILEEELDGTTTITHANVGEVGLVRLYFVVDLNDKLQNFDKQELEEKLADASRSWSDKLMYALHAIKDGAKLYKNFGEGFPASYREKFQAHDSLKDLPYLDRLYEEERLQVRLYQDENAVPHHFKLHVFALDNALPLSDIMPVLENFGLRIMGEIPHKIVSSHSTTVAWIHDFDVITDNQQALDLKKLEKPLAEVLLQVWSKQAENDGLNALVLYAGLSWREVVILRAYSHYFKQINFAYSQTEIKNSLRRYPVVAKLFIDLFNARFDPENHHHETAANIEAEIREILIPIASIMDDRILYTFLDTILATKRTNFYLNKSYISFKIMGLDDIPAPKPFAEIYVYSADMEAIHLRGGKVARGGIRWSDRHNDFRTEVLGLMKAQLVKNAVIVPTGSKGGFISRKPTAGLSREALQSQGIEAYKTMMRGLLDITDNMQQGKVIPAKNIVRLDDDDPYLVVAADKGTATFSDIANAISQEYGFWLDDAFASGGSAGYDHKVMGITARGAWEAVKRHFRELGKNIQQENFSVIGVGDMSGDVFGNGMLLSPHIQLKAAFNHMHIFVDPSPDAATSFAERQRLFDLPRSSWADYNESLLSKGGRIYSRNDKSLDLTPEIKQWLGLEVDSVSPTELIKTILKANAELLWFGGIGTYIKAREESNLDSGDKANDAVRVNACEVRAQVIGEGANLGMTQAARINFALLGGKINTDAIDNSAGVDCSDHEVNIKILLKQIKDLKNRDALLESMTEAVAHLVLRDNYLQTQALSYAEFRGSQLLHQQKALIKYLEKKGTLNRNLEELPSDEEIEERFKKGTGLTRPELSVLLAYAKIDIVDVLLRSKLPDEPLMLKELLRYFPQSLQKQYAKDIEQHPLRREIIVTATANSIVNRMGAHFVLDLQQSLGAEVCDIVRAYITTRDSFGLRDLWSGIEALDNEVSAFRQLHLIKRLNQMITYAMGWFIRNQSSPIPITDLVKKYKEPIRRLRPILPELMRPERQVFYEDRRKRYAESGVEPQLAKIIAYAMPLASCCDIVYVADNRDIDVETTARVHFGVEQQLGIDWLRQRAEKITPENNWQQQALESVLNDLNDVHRRITSQVLELTKGTCPDVTDCIHRWQEKQTMQIVMLHQLIEDYKQQPTLDIPMLMVAVSSLKQLS